jgi:hypothetical protein
VARRSVRVETRKAGRGEEREGDRGRGHGIDETGGADPPIDQGEEDGDRQEQEAEL